MAGYIRKLEVIRNTRTVVYCYGFSIYFQCLVARRGETFLGILSKNGRI